MSSREMWRCRAESRVVLRLGTRGILGRHPEGFSRFGHSGHVAYSEDIRGVSPGLGIRGTLAPGKTSGGILPVWALGTHGTLGRLPGKVPPVWALGTRGALARYPEGGTRCGLPGHVARSEGKIRKGLSVWLSGHVARSEGFRRGF